jgi:tetratricopeptide (TPR) repeat protein
MAEEKEIQIINEKYITQLRDRVERKLGETGGACEPLDLALSKERKPVVNPRVVYQGEPGAYSEMAAIDFFGRAIDKLLLRNVDSAIEDAGKAIAMVPDFSLAYFLRFNARCLKLEMEQANSTNGTTAVNAEAQKMLSEQMRRTSIDSMLADINMVIRLSPRNTYAYYNLAHVQASIDDFSNALINYSKAIELKPDLGEAYFNRGLIYLRLGDKSKGTADLSKAGELGVLASYNILKRMAP